MDDFARMDVALWSTMKMFPLTRDGEFANGLAACRQAAVTLHQKLSADERFITPLSPDLDIIIWAPKGKTTSDISALSEATFNDAEKKDLYLATFSFPSALIKKCYPEVEVDTEYTTCLRSALMKPEHLDWLDRIWDVLNEVDSIVSNR